MWYPESETDTPRKLAVGERVRYVNDHPDWKWMRGITGIAKYNDGDSWVVHWDYPPGTLPTANTSHKRSFTRCDWRTNKKNLEAI